MLLLIMLLNTSTFPYFRTTKKSLDGSLLVASAMSRLRVCFVSASCLLRLGPKETAIKHIAKRYPKSFSTNHISTRTFHQKTKLERSKIKIAECRIKYVDYMSCGLVVVAINRSISIILRLLEFEG